VLQFALRVAAHDRFSLCPRRERSGELESSRSTLGRALRASGRGVQGGGGQVGDHGDEVFGRVRFLRSIEGDGHGSTRFLECTAIHRAECEISQGIGCGEPVAGLPSVADGLRERTSPHRGLTAPVRRNPDHQLGHRRGESDLGRTQLEDA
jgi:hypothetical protein